GHAGDDRKRYARCRQRLRLLAASPEHERIAPFEPHDSPPGRAVLYKHSLDLRLRGRLAAAPLAHVDELGIRARVLERAGRDQPVINDHLRRRDQLERSRREQAGVPRPGPHEVDGHAASSRCARRSTSPAPAASIRSATAIPKPSPSPTKRSVIHWEPSGSPTQARSSISHSPTGPANAPTGVLQVAFRCRVSSRSARTHAAVKGSSSASTTAADTRPLRPSTARAPWPAAGTSSSSTPPISPNRPRRSSPARASTNASAAPSASLRSRVSTLPRISRISRSSRSARIWAARLRLLVPTEAPGASEASEVAPQIASRGSA